jgi:hypothetical protein
VWPAKRSIQWRSVWRREGQRHHHFARRNCMDIIASYHRAGICRQVSVPRCHAVGVQVLPPCRLQGSVAGVEHCLSSRHPHAPFLDVVVPSAELMPCCSASVSMTSAGRHPVALDAAGWWPVSLAPEGGAGSFCWRRRAHAATRCRTDSTFDCGRV